ncbi:MAG: oligosaccharide flippase family protein [Flavobacteriales bacterium]|nr:oligosaccharide flippase family protein [Flavobacteriales bacterium]
MLKLIIRQANWGILGSIFAFAIGFFVKIYVIDIVGISNWGKYVSAHTFSTFMDVFLTFGIPVVIVKFFPDLWKVNKEYALQFLSKILKLSVVLSFVLIISLYFVTPLLDRFVYTNIDGFSLILFLVALHTPISIFTGIITALYRSVLKIKEIIIYSTVITVPIRAVLAFVIFQYTNNILYFIGIELFTTSLSLLLLFKRFNKDEYKLMNIPVPSNFIWDNKMISYGKKMYANAIVHFFSAQSLRIVLSIALPPLKLGVYSILLTITGVSMFLIKNLNQVFAPAISKLYHEKKIDELDELYKKTTFIVNLITLPFMIIIMIFADEILILFDKSGDLLAYKPYLFGLMIARMISLFAGSSGTFMIMAGLEKKELKLQTIKAILISILAIILVMRFELVAIVSLFIGFMLFINISQLIYIKRNVKISPFSSDLLKLILLTIPLLYFSIITNYNFSVLEIILTPVLIYLLFFVLFIKQIKDIVKMVR